MGQAHLALDLLGRAPVEAGVGPGVVADRHSAVAQPPQVVAAPAGRRSPRRGELAHLGEHLVPARVGHGLEPADQVVRVVRGAGRRGRRPRGAAAASSHQNGRRVPTRPGSTKATAGMPRARSRGRPRAAGSGDRRRRSAARAVREAADRRRGPPRRRPARPVTPRAAGGRADDRTAAASRSRGRPGRRLVGPPVAGRPRWTGERRRTAVGRMPNAGHAHPSPDGHRGPKVAPAPQPGTGDVDVAVWTSGTLLRMR